MASFPIIPIVLGGILLILFTAMLYTIRVQRRSLCQAHKRIDALSSNLNALCAGAVGVDQRVTGLEQKSREQQQQLESMASNQQSERPYGEAIHLVHQGATPHRLVEELGLSRSEADLVVMLHGVKKAG